MKLLGVLLLLAGVCSAQYNLPPGTSSSVPESEAKQVISAEQAALQKAEAAIVAQQFDDAVTVLKPLAVASQKNERVFYDLAFAQDALGNDADAVTAYRAAIALDGSDAAARVSLGLLLARGGKIAEAKTELNAALKVPGADPSLLAKANRALAQMDLQGDPEKARAELLAALKVSKEESDDAVLAAEIADALQDDAEAEAGYARAYGMKPDDAEVGLEYARLLAREKKFAQAHDVLEKTRTVHPNDERLVAEEAAELLLQGNAADAVPLLLKLHTAKPADAAITLLLARAYALNGAEEKADTLYGGLLAASPDNPVLLTEMGDNLIREKRAAEAEPLLEKALQHKDAFPTKKALADAAGELAFAAQSNHHPETTLRALAIRESLVPLTAPFTFLRASAHDTLRHTKEAAAAYRAFLQQSAGSLPDQEWQAQQRLTLLERSR